MLSIRNGLQRLGVPRCALHYNNSERLVDTATTSGVANNAGGSYSVLVVHPKVRWGSGSASVLKNAERQLAEAASLVDTLPYMVTVEKIVLPVDYNTKRKRVWGAGSIEKLLEMREEARATALMVNVDVLNPMQQEELFRIFGVPVFDRYNIVMSIFKAYAQTEEARLQIALAELPYIKSRVHMITSRKVHSPPSVFLVQQTFAEHDGNDLNEVLRKREQELTKRLKQAVGKSEEACKQASSNSAVVAVVGYTNAGKTSLVKRLTGAECLEPKDRLFATLDTSRHTARLPSGRAVTFADTIGFLSDLPTSLIAAFQATLSHIKFADVIIHLRDVSHPDWRAQDEDVVGTLKSIGIDDKTFTERVVTVDNKVDVEGAATVTDAGNDNRVSCQTGQGMRELVNVIEKKVLSLTNCKRIRLTLNAASPAINFLYREKLVVNEPEPVGDSLVFDVVMTESEMARFQAKFQNVKQR